MDDPIRAQWKLLLDRADPELRRMAARAAEEPSLWALFPYMSLSRLRFSRSTTYPYEAMPYIRPLIAGSVYELRDAENRPITVGSLDYVVRALVRQIGA